MTKTNPANERIKRDYFVYLREARRASEASVDAAAKAISRFEETTGHKNFDRFHREQAMAFKRKLNEQTAVRTGQKLSRATVHSTLAALRAFFLWLADKPGYKRRISYSDADYFNLPEKDVRVAKASRVKPAPTLDQIQHVLSGMPLDSDVEKRDRALIAFAILTGARDGALATLRLKHVDLQQGVVHQDARDVQTKFSKTFSTWFFPVGDLPVQIVSEWVEHLKSLHWGDHDPLFPAPEMGLSPHGGFQVIGLSRRCWTTAEPIRRIFRQAFESAGLPYFNPHSFRDTLAQLGERICTTPEEFKAWSQNLGHEHVLTTFTSYGAVAPSRQAELIRKLGSGDGTPDAAVEAAVALLRQAAARLAPPAP